MAKLWFAASAALALATMAACSSPPSPQQRIEATEQAALAPLKKDYPRIITAFDINGSTLDIAIDANAYIQTGDNAVDAFKKQIVKSWRAAWLAAHPHQHALLIVQLRDFINRVWYTARVQA
jgi:hypothetical protein